MPSAVRALAAALPFAALPFAASVGRAQQVSPACSAQGQLENACQQAADIFAFLAPQLGTAIAGGNATPGLQGALGHFGRVAVGLRLNVVRGEVPDVSALPVGLGPAAPSTIPVTDRRITMPQADAAFGIFPGIPLTYSTVGAIDLIVSGAWLPTVRADDLQFESSGSRFRLGAGVRVGLVQESFFMPGLSVSYLRRGLPTAELTASAGDDTLRVSDVRATTDSWRIVAGKNLFGLALAAGIGQDRYDASATAQAVVNEAGLRFATVAPVVLEQRLTRYNAFGNATINLAVLRLVGEIGSAWGGSVSTFNSFEGTTADAARLYGSVGLRLGF